jgi:hypothetical protein
MREILFSNLANRELDKFIAEGIGLEGVAWKPTPFEITPALIYEGKTELPCPVPYFSAEKDTAFLLLEKIRERAQTLVVTWERGEKWDVCLKTLDGVVFTASHKEYARTVALVVCDFFAHSRKEK